MDKAIGLITQNEYSKFDILDTIEYVRMKRETLLDEDDCLVIPVRNKKSPYFRKISKPSFGKRIQKVEDNDTHNECVNYIQDILDRYKIKISTYVFLNEENNEENNEEKEKQEQIIFTQLKDSNYKWFKEIEARIGFSDNTYIQPDLAGRDVNKFFPRSAYPNIIIEVIRTHEPEWKTIKKLYELSRMNTIVLFYFIGEGKKTSEYNHIYFDTEDKYKVIRVTHYMIDGKVFKNGKVFWEKFENEDLDKWCKDIKNSFFLKAKEKLSNIKSVDINE